MVCRVARVTSYDPRCVTKVMIFISLRYAVELEALKQGSYNINSFFFWKISYNYSTNSTKGAFCCQAPSVIIPSLPSPPAFPAGEQLKGATARRVHEMELKRHLVIN